MANKKKNLAVSKDRLKRKEATTPKIVQESGNVRPINTVIKTPKCNSSHRSFDFLSYYGKGFDDIVNRVYYIVLALLETSTKGGVTQDTIDSYLRMGFHYFADYLQLWRVSLSRELTINDINRDLIDNYILHLKGLGVGEVSQKNYYTYAKSLLKFTASHGYWPDISKQELNALFPRNPYPNSHKKVKGEKPFTQHEKRQLVLALKEEIKSIYEKTEPLSSYELTVCVLSIAMQTGINNTPLLKMKTDCLTDHPLKENRKLLTVYKARGSATQLHNLRYHKNVEFTHGIKLDVAYLIELIIRLHSELRNEKGTDDLLVYRSKYGMNAGEITTLSVRILLRNISKLIKKYGLKDDDGLPIKVNISRIRKTFINDIYELSGHDILFAAKAGKHDKHTTDAHYLTAPEESKRDLGILGEVRVKNLTSKTGIENTPVASCKDVINGHKAPKDGTPCVNYLACFTCKSFVITGDDLYRMYSFYWAVVGSRTMVNHKEWKKHLRHIIRVIDENISPQFPAPKIEAIKERARINPHPFWLNPYMLRLGK